MNTHSKFKLRRFQSVEKLGIAAAEYILEKASQAIAERNNFNIVLSGGNTPQQVYALLAKPEYNRRIDWSKVFIFWGDERFVPATDISNNAHQAKLHWLDHVPIPRSHIHPIPVNSPPDVVAQKYEDDINIFFGKDSTRFDLILLGLGENGHTASLFPGTKVIEETHAGVRAVYIEEEKRFRVTMTAPLINQARNILFLVSGKSKAAILHEILNGPYQPARYPAQLIHAMDGTLEWYVDEAAGTFENC